jgi:ubiquinone biosynthesis protein UbiJ
LNTLTRLFESALNHYLRLDPDALSRLSALSGKVIAFESGGFRCCLKPGADGIEVLEKFDGAPDAVIRGTPWGMLRLALPGHAREAFGSGAVEISGDVELGRRFKQLFDGMDIDWEEQLSGVTGDVIAHQIGRAACAARGFGRNTLATLGRDFAEYQQYEARTLPASHEIMEFLSAVDTLRDDTARLEARIARLQRRLADSKGGAEGA